MNAGTLIPDLGDKPGFGIDAEDGDAVLLQAVRCIEKAAVGREVNICAAMSAHTVTQGILYGGERRSFVGQHSDVARKLIDQVGIAAIGREGEMSGSGARGGGGFQVSGLHPSVRASRSRGEPLP